MSLDVSLLSTSMDDAIAYEFFMDTLATVFHSKNPDDLNLKDIDTAARVSYSMANAFAKARKEYWTPKTTEETTNV